MPKPIVLAVHYPAGGTAKSITTYAIASYLSLKFRVLVIDLDGGQGTTTNALLSEAPALTAYEVLTRSVAFTDAIVPASGAYPSHLQVLAGSPKLPSLEGESALDKPYWLAEQLEDLAGFDFIVIDTPPAAGTATLMGLTAAMHVLTPVACEPKTLAQLPAWGHFFAALKRRINPQLEWLGLLPTRLDTRNALDLECARELEAKFPDIAFQPIRSAVKLRECMAKGLPPWHQSSSDYLTATNTLLSRLNHDQIQEALSAGTRFTKANRRP